MNIDQRIAEMQQTDVFNDANVLTGDCAPTEIVGREQEYENLVEYVLPLTRGNRPDHGHVFGRGGTGKTAVVTDALEELRASDAMDSDAVARRIGVHGKSGDGILRAIINEFRDDNPVKYGEHDLYRKLWRELEAFGDDPDDRTPVLLVLDAPGPLSDLDDLVYELTRANADALETVSLATLWITHDAATFAGLSAGADSSFHPVPIEFSRYDASDLREILAARAGDAFHETTVTEAADGYEVEGAVLSDGVLDRVATLAEDEYGGDARNAMELLHGAGFRAKRTADGLVTADHVEAEHEARL